MCAFDDETTLRVEKGSYAEQWCIRYNHKYSSAQGMLLITKDTLLRTEPNNMADVMRSIMAGNIVDEQDRSGSWIKVETENNVVGWIPDSAVK